jgi:hypothetical protein
MVRIERLNNLHVYLVHIYQFLRLLSELKSFLQSFVEDLLSTIFHFQSTDDSFFCEVALHLNFRVLLPTSYVFWHVEFNLLFKEIVHLLLYRIRLAADDEGAGVIDACHLVEVFVGVGEAAHNVELSIKNILSVASVLHTVVHNQLDHNFLGLVAMEGQIFTITRNYISVFPEPFFNASFAV